MGRDRVLLSQGSGDAPLPQHFRAFAGCRKEPLVGLCLCLCLGERQRRVRRGGWERHGGAWGKGKPGAWERSLSWWGREKMSPGAVEDAPVVTH